MTEIMATNDFMRLFTPLTLQTKSIVFAAFAPCARNNSSRSYSGFYAKTQRKNRLLYVSQLFHRVEPRYAAAEAVSRSFASHDLKDFKHRRDHRLSGQHCARGINEKTSLDAEVIRELAQGRLNVPCREGCDLLEPVSKPRKPFTQARLFLQILADGGVIQIAGCPKIGACLRRKIFQRNE